MAERRGLWKGTISFGLLNIPVSLHSATQEHELHFHLLDSRDFAPVKYRRVNANTGKEVPYEQIVKGYKYEPEAFVVVGKQDFTAANPKATQAIDIEDFVSVSEIDPMYFERPYYILPAKGAQKSYVLLRDALTKSEKIAIGKVVIRTKQHLAAILARGDFLILEILRFSHEVRALEKDEEDLPSKKTYNTRELKMAEDLINGMTGKWHPEKYKDTYYRDLKKRIETKIKQGKTHILEDEEIKTPPSPRGQNVVDLIPLLKKSLAENQKRKKKAK